MEDSAVKLHLQPANFDRRGLVCAYDLAQGVHLAPDVLDDPSQPGPLWLHFNVADSRARKWLHEQSGLPPAVLAILLESHPRVRLHVLKDGLAATLRDLQHDFRDDPEGFGEFRFYMNEKYIISARRTPLRSVDRLRRSLDAGLKIDSTASWLERLLNELAESFGETVQELVDKVDDLEDEIVAGRGTEHRATLTHMRRLLVRFRRHVHSDRAALSALRTGPSQDALAPLRQALDHLDGVAQDIELVHERVRLLQEELASLLAEATNRNLYLLSVVTTVLLPATLVTGVWGMNVPGLPWSADDHGFAWTGLTLAGSILVSLVLLRRSRVL